MGFFLLVFSVLTPSALLAPCSSSAGGGGPPAWPPDVIAFAHSQGCQVQNEPCRRFRPSHFAKFAKCYSPAYNCRVHAVGTRNSDVDEALTGNAILHYLYRLCRCDQVRPTRNVIPRPNSHVAEYSANLLVVFRRRKILSRPKTYKIHAFDLLIIVRKQTSEIRQFFMVYLYRLSPNRNFSFANGFSKSPNWRHIAKSGNPAPLL